MDKITTTVTMTLADFAKREVFVQELKERVAEERHNRLHLEREYEDACSLLRYWGKTAKLPLRSPHDKRFFKRD